ncbi:hypothetical protein CBR_g34189 [Chara braunii]|uniref:VWFA domain-containing protein n=1 Tax=Chara braunii TaxID=69332 RepID=A0A388LI69_CHABU|nr:hypothetical protein CBR_g34189 [Chara braunii]|eukprot:GBG82009.1 hypothetical protein CBR_g34189 [Chara braunii]
MRGWSLRVVIALLLLHLMAVPPSDKMVPFGMRWLSSPAVFVDAANVQELVKNMTALVRSVGDEAKKNEADSCPRLDNCRLGQGTCVRMVCGYTGNESFTCEGNFRFDSGTCGSPDACTQTLLSYEEGFARLPFTETVQAYDAMCVQQTLSATLSKKVRRDDFLSIGWIYYGSFTGFFLSFPGKQDACVDYDPRKRPWFAEATSPRKRVVIVLDLAAEMFIPLSSQNGRNRFQMVNSTVFALLGSLRRDDEVALVTYSSATNDTDTSLEIVLGSQATATQSKLLNLNTSAMGAASSDLRDGIMKGLNVLRAAPKPGDADVLQEVLLVFTLGTLSAVNGGNVSTTVDAILQYNSTTQVKSGVRVFLYGVEVKSPVDYGNIQQIAKSVNGFAKNMGTRGGTVDPLGSIYSYFNFLAKLQPSDPKWVAKYEDFGELGDVNTMSMPVFDGNGNLIGASGMDMTVKLEPSDKDALKNITDTMTSNVKISYPTAIGDALNVTFGTVSDPLSDMDGIPDLCPGVSVSLKKENVVCAEKQPKVSDDVLRCCGDCLARPAPPPSPKKGSGSKSNTVVIVVLTVGGFLVALGGLGYYFVMHSSLSLFSSIPQRARVASTSTPRSRVDIGKI